MNNTIRLVLLFQLSLTYGLTLEFHLRIPAQAQAQGPALGSHLRVPPYGPTLGSYHLRVQPKNPGSRVPPYVSGSHFSAMSGLQVCNFIKKRFQHRCFPVKFAKFLRTPFLQNTSDGSVCTLNRTFQNYLLFLIAVLRIFSQLGCNRNK